MATGPHIPSNPVGAAAQASQEEASREAYALLAQANLLRMRGQWSEAVAKCMAALKLSPDNASAQSLLGDIYENQGLLDDAIQWYRMALDVSPDSPADKMKLARVVESKSRTLSHSSPPTAGDAAPRRVRDPEPAPMPVAPPTERFSVPETLLRRTAYGAGGLTLTVILLALGFTRWAPHGRPDRQLNVPNVVVPSLASSPSVTPPAAPTAYAPAPSDPAEQDLLAALRGVPNMALQGIEFTTVESDPRAGRLTVTVTCQSATTPPTRELVLRDAVRAVQAAVQVTSAQAYTQFTVRCLGAPPAGGGSTPLLLVADATRAAVTALPTDLSATPSSQILAAFSNPWWSSVVSSSS